ATGCRPGGLKEKDRMEDTLDGQLPLLYTELAGWFHLLTSPEEYVAEAGVYTQAIIAACDRPPVTLLELGSGGGNNASHLKRQFTCTLTDPAPGMLELSRGINPECEHIL